MSASQKEQQEREANRARTATEKKRFRNKKATEPEKRSQVLFSPRHNEESQKRGTATKHANRSQVLLSPRHNEESQKRGTATKHANRSQVLLSPRHNEESQKRATATKHANRSQVLLAPRHNEKAQKRGTATNDEQKKLNEKELEELEFKLKGFLAHVARFDFLLSEPEINNEDIEDMIFEKIVDWRKTPRNDASYSYSELKLHKKLWNNVISNKDGSAKDHDFMHWCRRIARHRTESIPANSAATEHDEPFKKLIKDIFAKELTSEQKKKREYKLPKATSTTTRQRSLVNVILRKNVGDHRVAWYILKHGLPTLLEAPLGRRCEPSLKREDVDFMLEELMKWHVSLLKWLANRKSDPNYAVAQMLSDPNEKEWQVHRRRQKTELDQELRQGAFLAFLRDTKTKRYRDMSPTEQYILHEYETGRLQKRRDNLRIRKPK